MFVYQIATLLIVNELIVYCGHLMVSSTVGLSYFTLKSDRSLLKSFKLSMRNVIKHIGSVMLSCFILIVPWPRAAFMALLKSQKRPHLPSLSERILRLILSCSKHGLANMALTGNDLMMSSKSSYLYFQKEPILKQILSVVVTSNAIGRCFVVICTVILGLLIAVLWKNEENRSFQIFAILLLIIGYAIGGIAMNAFTASVNTLMQCFLIDRKVFKDRGAPQLAPRKLLAFMQDNDIRMSEITNDQEVRN